MCVRERVCVYVWYVCSSKAVNGREGGWGSDAQGEAGEVARLEWGGSPGQECQQGLAAEWSLLA